MSGLSSGLRLSSIIVIFAGIVVWRYLPARAADHDELPAATPEDLQEIALGSLAAGE